MKRNLGGKDSLEDNILFMALSQDPLERKRQLEEMQKDVHTNFHLLTIKQSNQEAILKTFKEDVAEAQNELERTEDPELKERLEQNTIPALVRQVGRASEELAETNEMLKTAKETLGLIEKEMNKISVEFREKERKKEEKRRRKKPYRK